MVAADNLLDPSTQRDGREALEQFLSRDSGFGLVLLDVDMPRMGGPECFERLKEIDPKVRVVFFSGRADASVEKGLLAGGAKAFLYKPVDPNTLKRTIAGALAH